MKKYLSIFLALMIMFGLIGYMVATSEKGKAAPERMGKAAPAIANEILREHGIRGGRGQLINEVAKELDDEAVFPTYDAVYNFLVELGADLPPPEPGVPPEPVVYELAIYVEGDGTTVPAAGTHSYEEDTVVTVTATPEPGWAFVEWTGAVESTEATVDVTMDADKSITAVFEEIPPVVYELTIAVEGEGTTEPAPGTHSYVEDSVVTVTAIPEPGWAFLEWTGDVGTVADASATETTITMEGDYTITAVFELITYTITATAGAGGSIDPDGEVPIFHGSDQTFTITPDQGYVIADVLVDGDSVGAVGGYTFENVTSARTISASFAAETVNYNLTLTSTAGGSVTVPGEGTFTYAEGTVVNLTAVAEDGYEFVGWTGDVGTVADASAASTTITMEVDYTITAVFGEIPPLEYVLTIEVEGEGSTVPAEGTHSYAENSVVTVTADPTEGWQFVGWTGAVESTEAAVDVTMDTDKSITAVFAEIPSAPLSALLADLYREDDPDLFFGIRTLVGGVFNVELSMDKVLEIFGDISGSGYQLKFMFDEIVIIGQDAEENLIDMFLIETTYALLPAVQQGNQTEDITINISILLGSTVWLVN